MLTVLTPTIINAEFKDRISDVLFSDDAKASKSYYFDKKTPPEGKQQYYQTFRDLTVIHYGGAQPQNIGYLNLYFYLILYDTIHFL